MPHIHKSYTCKPSSPHNLLPLSSQHTSFAGALRRNFFTVREKRVDSSLQPFFLFKDVRWNRDRCTHIPYGSMPYFKMLCCGLIVFEFNPQHHTRRLRLTVFTDRAFIFPAVVVQIKGVLTNFRTTFNNTAMTTHAAQHHRGRRSDDLRMTVCF